MLAATFHGVCPRLPRAATVFPSLRFAGQPACLRDAHPAFLGAHVIYKETVFTAEGNHLLESADTSALIAALGRNLAELQWAGEDGRQLTSQKDRWMSLWELRTTRKTLTQAIQL